MHEAKHMKHQTYQTYQGAENWPCTSTVLHITSWDNQADNQGPGKHTHKKMHSAHTTAALLPCCPAAPLPLSPQHFTGKPLEPALHTNQQQEDTRYELFRVPTGFQK